MQAWLGGKSFFLIQMLLTFGSHCNRHFWDIQLKMLRLPNFNNFFQLVLTKFFKSNKKVLFASFPRMDLAKNFNTTPLTLTLASQSFCKTIIWKLYGRHSQMKSSYGNSMELKKWMLIGMDYLWYIEKLVFHIISIQIMGQSYGANTSVLWNNYGHWVAIALPYDEKHQLFFPYIFFRLHFAKRRFHISSVSSLSLPIPFPHIGNIWPKLCHIIPIVLFW